MNLFFTDNPISPTAFYTGFVWYENGFSHPVLKTFEGEFLYKLISPFDKAAALLSDGMSVESYLISRHCALDSLLEKYISEGFTQIIEVAAGLSPRPFIMANRHSGVEFIETDLPTMSAKQSLIFHKARLSLPNHKFYRVDITNSQGKDSLSELIEQLDKNKKTLLITEGLLHYLNHEILINVFENIYKFLNHFSEGVYLSDYFFSPESEKDRTFLNIFQFCLEAFVQGKVYFHYPSSSGLERDLKFSGFSEFRMFSPLEMPVCKQLNLRKGFAAIAEAKTKRLQE